VTQWTTQDSLKQNSNEATRLHDGTMAEHDGLPEWGLAFTMVYGFQRFRAQIKAEDEGFSLRGTPGGGDHRKVAHDGKASALVLNNGGRELQGAELTGSSSNGCNTASASLSGSRHGPKHLRVVALCMGPVASVQLGFRKNTA
jgi:hypothetical protein